LFFQKKSISLPEILSLMVACIDDIKTKIETVKNKTDSSIIDEVAIDAYLDKILAVRQIADNMASDVDNLVEDLYEFFSRDTSPELFVELRPYMETLNAAATRFYNYMKESEYSAGAKASLEEFRLSIGGLEEIIHDLVLFRITLPNCPRLQELAKRINEMHA